jgi:demethylmenaquinone methyltransferase/2-methoxy-6-polyprenyl-1,4-benzoquinol methylase
VRVFDAHSYDSVAWCYDELAEIYSLGRIGRSKRETIASLKPGERVLFAGVGRGREAIEAVRSGVRVTAVDLSPRMLGRFSRAMQGEARTVNTVLGDVALHRPEERYDAVVANYFLNLFDAEHATNMLEKLCSFVRPGGSLYFADFAPPEGGKVSRWMTEAYYRPVNWIGWGLGYCALHPIPDYPRMLASLGIRVRSVRRFPLLWGGAPAFVAISAERGS